MPSTHSRACHEMTMTAEQRQARQKALEEPPSVALNGLDRDLLRRSLARFTGDPEPSGCIHWRGEISTVGYGRVYIAGRRYQANRAAYVLANGPLDPALLACHRCDNRRCVNPDHLFAGTYSDNALDASGKGRLAYQTRPETILHGDTCGASKLTSEQVREILASPLNARQIAPLYGVHFGTVNRIRQGVRWWRESGRIPKDSTC